MIDHDSFIVNVLKGTVVEFFQSAFKRDDNVLWLVCLRLVQAAVTVGEDTLEDIVAIHVAILQ